MTLDGNQFLVEVKNYHSKDPAKPYEFKKSYLDKIIAYAEKMNVRLKFAIYWSRWNIWTMVDTIHLDRSSAVSTLVLRPI